MGGGEIRRDVSCRTLICGRFSCLVQLFWCPVYSLRLLFNFLFLCGLNQYFFMSVGFEVERNPKQRQSGREIQRNLQVYSFASFVWWFCQCHGKRSTFSATQWSSSGCRHMGSLLTKEEQKKVGSWHSSSSSSSLM